MTPELEYPYEYEETVDFFLSHAYDFFRAHSDDIVRYYRENDMPFDPEQVAQETWDMLLDGSYERP